MKKQIPDYEDQFKNQMSQFTNNWKNNHTSTKKHHHIRAINKK